MMKQQYYPVRLPLLLLPVIIGLFSVGDLRGQVSVNPTRIVLTSSQRSREIAVFNPTNQQMVVDARIQFMILRSDSLGTARYDTLSSAGDGRQSCTSWLKIFPRQFTLPPGASRKVRMLISPPDSIADGEYLSRLVVGGLPVDRPLTPVSDTNGIRASMAVKLELNLPVMYRHGNVATSIAFDAVAGRRADSQMTLLVDLKPGGNCSYRGTLFSRVTREDGSIVDTNETQVTVETDYRQQLHFFGLNDGVYRLSVEARAVRKGSASETVIPAAVVAREYRLGVRGKDIALEPLH